ncbi:MAG: c-type cytochrome [Gammaproteobacteria bacterium]|nr:c-type cytochrome [Gammaproteobacteria bacterium]NIR83421.1 c-type cytochrome [Gammaproteobacteria bacterium]NIR91343.1 c-type cytochrome [Gammaproteobacteria bacterium]NIU04583.1 c-type cytochrome [Gammaproteobacteria bacterium]NIV51625.1 c-type cytochrome [Gammaproteobacteria bacterium]
MLAAVTGVGEAAPPAVDRDTPATFGFGRPASEAQIEAWDVDVMPDGRGLPPGRGTVAEGASIYADRCAKCHGATGREGPFAPLVGREPREGFPFGKHPLLLGARTIGNYWPYATTLYDYLSRAMPFDAPGSLTADEVYALAAYLLYRNDIVSEDTIMDARTLPRVQMPARDRFVRDDRRGGREVR